MRTVLLIVPACLAIALLPSQAQAVDPHRLYEQSCAGCHGAHAGEFATAALGIDDGRLVDLRSGSELRLLLTRHRGVALDEAEIAALVEHFSAIVEAGGVFRTKCEICHDRAVRLARLQLVLRDGRLVGRYSGRDIQVFLGNHGRLTDSERDVILSMLRRQLMTAAE